MHPPLPYTLFLTGGLAAGLWNHSTTSDLAKWVDRGMMGAGTVITLLIAPTASLRLLMLLTVAAYAAGKRYNSVMPHLAAHWLITFINLHIMLSFQ